jgi:hypothetical protein
MITMDMMLKDLALDSLSLLYYSAPPSALAIFLGFLLFEASSFSVSIFTYDLCFVLLLNGLLAFSLNIAVIYLVASTSAMVISISGPIKDITIVIMSVVIFRAPVTVLQVCCCCCCCCCCVVEFSNILNCANVVPFLYVLQICGFAVSLSGLVMYRSYKADSKGMNAWFSDTFCCTGVLATNTRANKEITGDGHSNDIMITMSASTADVIISSNDESYLDIEKKGRTEQRRQNECTAETGDDDVEEEEVGTGSIKKLERVPFIRKMSAS